MQFNLADDDFLVLNHEAEYWTGTDWYHHPELSMDMALEDAVMLATENTGSTILIASMMIHVDHGVSAERDYLWVEYPDNSSDRYRDMEATFVAISDWLEKCAAPPTSLLEQNIAL